MKFYYQSELDNLDNTTIKEIEESTEEAIPNWLFFKYVEEFENLRDNSDKLEYLENLAIDLELKEYNLTDIQKIIIAHMFINDLFSKAYTSEVMELLDEVLL